MIMPQPLKSGAVNPKDSEGHQQGQTKGQQRGTQMLSSRHQGDLCSSRPTDGEAARCPATHIAVQGASFPAGVGLGGPRVKRCGVGQGGPIKPLQVFGAFTGSNPLEAKSLLFATALHGWCGAPVRDW